MNHFPCPAHCQSTPNFELYAKGGDGLQNPFCAHFHQAVNFLLLVICILMLSTGFVGYDNALDSIIVVHEGNDKKQL
jgi:hypothetical protein